MCWIYRRTIDPATGEYTRGEYVGYVDTGKTLSGLEALDIHAGPPSATAKPVKPRFRMVADLREWRAWRRYRQAGGEDLPELPSYKCTCTPTPTPEAGH